MFDQSLLVRAETLLQTMRQRRLRLATAESCTGGLVAGLLTEIPGSSDVVERGFVVYSDAAKMSLLGVPEEVIQEHGAVSEAAARAMAEGALRNSVADLAVSVTGIAGPGGGSLVKPVGLVHFAFASRGAATQHRRHHIQGAGRQQVRMKSVSAALALIEDELATVTRLA